MIGVAIVGAGIGALHLKGYQALPERFSVKAICDLDLERARSVAGEDTSIRLTTDLDEILADESIQLIDVCLPPHLHFPVTLKAHAAGKDVVCEKPLVRSLEEANALIDSVKKTGRGVFPVFQYRFGHAMRQLRALIDAGLAGKAFVASSEVHWNRGASYYDIPWRGTWKGECGGAILGHAIHAHDLLCHVLGPVDEVFAMADTRVNTIETEDCAALSFRMKSGALATSSVTLGAAEDTSRLRFCFEGFTAESGTLPYRPAEDTWRFIARAPTTQDQIDAVLATVANGENGFAGFVEAIADAMEGRGGKEVTVNDGLQSIELVTAIYRSVREGKLVRLSDAAEGEWIKGWAPRASANA
ncbi:Gfo/Idh/MocA family oxidoreductase [Agrobacterium tumefaciens]|uniref:Oxidoreductase n=1 Tax=Agrobacterium tumefaciens TaxID=358 RepID=A0A2L2LGD9_AGRTU|nr:Gfo/Idh/MocA family oxidoreductase [Agrobacterium tumefaciens]AVH43414.1 oxidoreductase [Agrobacterium tumefaciens]NSY97359.1 Gfo/Idh/MocA family oxidoreductase [Agrobacterium tumefaciens]NSZ03541.1 Gfo/Idh/MocA family oxidoreductase [Agrobacterium tumefaciens]NSZ37789.1 Gfo/Idh/MocA family oxidoreductase [Agrobacterium tumefaciens]NTB03856.1 Gfo/Idh/MocA family oxidoreductase [Agrobacterium tumefaciens]